MTLPRWGRKVLLLAIIPVPLLPGGGGTLKSVSAYREEKNEYRNRRFKELTLQYLTRAFFFFVRRKVGLM